MNDNDREFLLRIAGKNKDAEAAIDAEAKLLRLHAEAELRMREKQLVASSSAQTDQA